MTETVERTCYRHPDRVTGLSCSECGRPICTECMTMAPVGIRCPEHAGGQRVVDRSRAFDVVAPVTRFLIAINLAVYVAELATGGGVNGDRGWIFEHGVLFGPLVQNGDWWRLITSAFMHYGPFHLLLNMYGLYWAGTILERAIGHWRFLLLYLVSGLAGSAGVMVKDAISSGLPSLTLGASGALFGVLGALFVLERRGHLATGGQIAGLIVINLVFTFAFARLISVGGHVGGLIGGVASMFLLLSFRGRPALGTAAVAAVGVLCVVIAYAVPL
ncbi:MAG: rhomboid family intramembrane serine protease [Gaiellaceae bacterium]